MTETCFDITPTTKPRMTQADKWKKRPIVMRYRAFCDICRLYKVSLPEGGASITFVIPMPKSWSNKKKDAMNGMPHQSRPDLSNLLKALEDALYLDDSCIWHYKELKKVWGRKGQIIIGS